MKTRRILAISLSLFFVATIALATEYPKAVGFVNDFAHVLSKEAAENLNKDLAEFEKETSVEIAVVTVTSLGGQDVKSYTIGLATKWGVGKRDKNNGIVFLIAPKQHKMRIQTASGIKSVLTDSKADEIRDKIILPRFKVGDMAQGIIEGTHAIMNAIGLGISNLTENTSTGSKTPAQDQPKAMPPASLHSEDPYWVENILIIFSLIFAGVVICLLILVRPIRRSRARKEVMPDRDKFRRMMIEADIAAKNQDVKNETRCKLGTIQTEFEPINQLFPNSPNINWIKARTKLDSLMEELAELISRMKEEITFAQKARKEGPELMQKIPEMIAAAEKKLAEDKPSEKANKLLGEAREQYAKVQSMQAGGMNMIDWVVLYMILSSINSNCYRAQEQHSWENAEHSSHNSESSGESSPGFGDSEGFGGGGSFDTGGGSTGEW